MVKVVTLRLYMADCFNLKDKRRILQSLMEKSKKMNVSIAETAELDTQNYAEVTFAVVSNSESYNQKIADKVIALFESDFRLTIADIIMQ